MSQEASWLLKNNGADIRISGCDSFIVPAGFCAFMKSGHFVCCCACESWLRVEGLLYASDEPGMCWITWLGTSYICSTVNFDPFHCNTDNVTLHICIG